MITSIITATHFLFDWVFQSRATAMNKKNHFTILLQHIAFEVVPYVSILTFIFYICCPTIEVYQLAHFWGLNVVSHLLIDWFLPSGKTNREVINWTALDQVLHLSILFLSFDCFIRESLVYLY